MVMFVENEFFSALLWLNLLSVRICGGSHLESSDRLGLWHKEPKVINSIALAKSHRGL